MDYFEIRIQKLRSKIDHLEVDLKRRKRDYLGKIVMKFRGRTYYVSRDDHNSLEAMRRTLDAAFSILKKQT